METKIPNADSKIKNVELFADNILKIISKSFSIDNKMRAELREPLIDLIMEKGIEISPTQRLLIILGRQILERQINFKSKKKSKSLKKMMKK